jgi:hypothetical protein
VRSADEEEQLVPIAGDAERAFGTASSEFVDASLAQLIAPARLPESGISEVAVNVALPFAEGARPQD